MIFLLAGIIAGAAFINYYLFRRPTAGLKVETTPPSLVFIDNVQEGISPINKFLVPGEVTVKIIPNSESGSLSVYQTRVRLTPKTFTVIKRDFGNSDEQSQGEIISLLPQSESKAGLSIVTSGPEAASVVIDGIPQGLTPLSLPSISPGPHQIRITAPGFAPRNITAQALSGYRLTINVKLSSVSVPQTVPTPTTFIPTPSPSTPSATPKVSITPTKVAGSPTPTPKTTTLTRPYVLIKDTPTGFLRVRSQPSTSSSEIGRVNPGESYKLLNTQSTWFQIQLSLTSSSSGWIASEYATKFE